MPPKHDASATAKKNSKMIMKNDTFKNNMNILGTDPQTVAIRQ